MNLINMSLDELLELSNDIAKEIKNRKSKIENIEKNIEKTQEKYEFYFEQSTSGYKRPYIAKMVNINNKIERSFYNFELVKENDMTVYGNYKARENDILDVWGEFNIVLNGELKKLKCDNSSQKTLIYKYVKNIVVLEDVLTLLDVQKIEDFEVLDELKD